MMINFHNFFISTEAVYKGCKTPKRTPDFISNSGSKYWMQENKRGKYVIRQSNHWVNKKRIGCNKVIYQCLRIASCQWHIKTKQEIFKTKLLTGKCYLKDFKTL